MKKFLRVLSILLPIFLAIAFPLVTIVAGHGALPLGAVFFLFFNTPSISTGAASLVIAAGMYLMLRLSFLREPERYFRSFLIGTIYCWIPILLALWFSAFNAFALLSTTPYAVGFAITFYISFLRRRNG